MSLIAATASEGVNPSDAASNTERDRFASMPKEDQLGGVGRYLKSLSVNCVDAPPRSPSGKATKHVLWESVTPN